MITVRAVLITWSDRVGDRAAFHDADRGPILRLLEQPEFADRYSCVWVLTTASGLAATRALISELESRIERVALRVLDVEDPSDHAQLFSALAPLCAEVRRAHRSAGVALDVLLSAGTPQAQTLWVILVQAGTLAARMLQVIPPRFVPHPHPNAVREVRLDIEGFPEIRALRDEVARLRSAANAQVHLDAIIGDSQGMRELRARILRIGRAAVPVLVFGETGTGKELVARALHQSSERAGGPFIAENCGAFAEGVLHSELFGHEAGAFTGASGRRRGLFEQAHGGTLFLDEVGELSPRVQATLLRVLQDGTLRRVGGEGALRVDVRIIAATHRDLKAQVAAGRFREDLYYRLCGATLELPPLRARIGDVPLLIDAFLEEARARHGKRLHVRNEALRALGHYAWPGNVRELRAEVQRWSVFCDDEVQLQDLSLEMRIDAVHSPNAMPPSQRAIAAENHPPLHSVVRGAEESMIRAVFAEQRENLLRTARVLAIDRNTLKRKLKAYGLYPKTARA